MARATVDTLETPEREQKPAVRDRVADACRHAAHLSHEARLVKSAAEDAIDDGVRAARRAIKSVRHRVEDLGDLKDEAVYRVKRQPLRAVGAAFGIGAAVGLVAGWIVARPRRRASTGGR